MKILFVLPVLSEAYCRKRIDNMRKPGVEFSVYGFEREHYEGEPWDTDVVSLGRVEDEKYFSRLLRMLQSVKQMRRAVKDHDLLYAFNLDILFLLYISSIFQRDGKKIVYDVADIRPILIQKGLIPSIMRLIEKFLLKYTSLIVVTSPAYIKGYFKGIQNSINDFLVIENKVDKNCPEEDSPVTDREKDHSRFVIGYFGGIKCVRSLEFLLELLRNKNNELSLILRGFFFRTEEYKRRLEKIPNASFNGPFIDPDDLEEIYSTVDLVWAAHMHGETNTKWAISNRFYQACCYKRPLIAQKNTQDARRIAEYDIGCIIDLNNPQKAIQQIQSIDIHDINRWRSNMNNIPKDVYKLTDEHDRLLNLIGKSP